jgi:hypothetical protein
MSRPGCSVLAVLSLLYIYVIRRTRAKTRSAKVRAQKTRSAGSATAQRQKREVKGPKSSAKAQAWRAFAQESEDQKSSPSCGKDQTEIREPTTGKRKRKDKDVFKNEISSHTSNVNYIHKQVEERRGKKKKEKDVTDWTVEK